MIPVNVVIVKRKNTTITNLSNKGVKRKMFSPIRNNPFVCLDEITGHPEPINPVIYNPNKDSIAFRTELLYRTIKNNLNVELTSEQLVELTRYDATELKAFISHLQKIINDYRSK